MNRPPKWKTPPTHAAADRLPMMSDAELDELAKDIKANGLQEPIILWRDNTTAADGAEGPFDEYLLDGRNRLAALKRLGITDPRQATLSRPGLGTHVRYLTAMVETSAMGGKGSTWEVDTDPVTYVLSANVYRRHLSESQKRDAIAAYIEADPTASDRKIGRALGVDHKTVGDVRKGSINGEIPQKSNQPVERAAAALRENPDRPNTVIAKDVGVSEYTIRKARKTLGIPASKPEPKTNGKPPGTTVRKYTDVAGVIKVLDTLAEQYEHATIVAALTERGYL